MYLESIQIGTVGVNRRLRLFHNARTVAFGRPIKGTYSQDREDYGENGERRDGTDTCFCFNRPTYRTLVIFQRKAAAVHVNFSYSEAAHSVPDLLASKDLATAQKNLELW